MKPHEGIDAVEILEKTVALVLAGGAGARLHPLTADRAKPAVPFGGKYRIIDFTLSNCLHSGLRRVLVLTQYKSHSLQKHLRDGWSVYNPELGEYITPVPPQMRTGESWYTGTADAVYQNLYLLERSGAEWVVILSGDHIYRMDYAAMVREHVHNGAAATIACMKVPLAAAKTFGVVEVDATTRITSFHEKPNDPCPCPDDPTQALVSMGVYVFAIKPLLEALAADHQCSDSSHDFGRDVLPQLVARERLCAYLFGGETGRVKPDRYWRDVGTIDSYYQANMDLLRPIPPLNLYQEDWAIRTYTGQHPPARTVPGASGSEGITINSIVASGAVVAGGSVQESILFSNVFVDDEAIVQRAVLFDRVRIGRGAHVDHCIIDKGVVVPAGEQIGIDIERDKQRFQVSPDGVVVIPRGYLF
ncbi:MAG: glucose-1-phosphate adenylyltransferase [Halothiobacillaceae bacterium]|nr:MAG: glucose-1-phosphate adenylyltransferase [Halothiobacillaceae bacterium]